jgi:hypothetical protein
VTVTLAPLTVPFRAVEPTAASSPTHCDKSFEGQTSVFAAAVIVRPDCAKFA